MGCKHSGQIWVFPPLPEATEKMRKPQCVVEGCKRYTRMICEKHQCLTCCSETPPCLCKGHANPRGSNNFLAEKLVAKQIKEGKMHRKEDGNVYPGPAPPKVKRKSSDIPAIERKVTKPRKYVFKTYYVSLYTLLNTFLL